ncbi:hypothetical protein N665_0188s0156 [Sinapis alba]|nr:hypothetical protein N665_0188s0156 [Sinapis alba]
MDFHGMKRKKLQALCKKHGIPANLKNIEMANRLSTLFQEDKTSPVRFKAMSDILSKCSVIESQRDGDSVYVGKTMNMNDKSLVGKKTDETLVTSEYNTENITVEEMEISKEGCMSVGHCVSNPESERGMANEIELLSSANRHGDLSEYNNTESSSAEEEQADICEVGRLSVGHCVRESLDEVSLKKPERRVSSERGCKVNVLEGSVSLSSAFASLSPMEEKVALHQLIPIHNAASSVLDESNVFTTPERNLTMMEQLNQNGKTLTGDSVNHQSDEAVESRGVVFTTLPEQVLLLGDCGLDHEEGKQEKHTATESPDVLNASQNEGVRVVVDLHDESNSVASLLIQSCVVGDFNGDGLERNKEIRTDELHCESGTITSSKVSQAENVSGQNATQGTSKKSKLNSPHVDSVIDIDGADTIMECNPESELLVETTQSPSSVQLAVSLPTGPILVKETVSTLIAEEDTKSNEEAVLKEHRFVAKLAEAEVILEQLSQNGKTLAGDSVNHNNDEEVESHTAVFTTPEHPDESDVLNTSQNGGESNVFELQDETNIAASPLKQSCVGDFNVELYCESGTINRHALTENSGGKNKAMEFYEEPVVFTGLVERREFSLETRQHLEKFEPHTVGKQEREEVEMKDVSAFFTRFETCLLLGESTHGILGNVTSGSSKYQSHHDSSPKVILKKESMVRGSHISALDLGDNTIPDSSGTIASKVFFYCHEFNAREETAGSENVAGLDATQGTSKQSRRGHSPHVDSANYFDLEIDGTSVLAGTCSLVPEESTPSTTIHDQINEALEELAITDELIETKVTTQRDDKGSLMEDEHLGL